MAIFITSCFCHFSLLFNEWIINPFQNCMAEHRDTWFPKSKMFPSLVCSLLSSSPLLKFAHFLVFLYLKCLCWTFEYMTMTIPVIPWATSWVSKGGVFLFVSINSGVVNSGFSSGCISLSPFTKNSIVAIVMSTRVKQ